MLIVNLVRLRIVYVDSGIRIKVECVDCDGLVVVFILKLFVVNVFYFIIIF